MSLYTIEGINANGSVDVRFSIDDKVQNISNLPIQDAASLTEALDKYAEAYEGGLAVEAVETQPKVVPPEVLALVGQARTVDPVS